MVLWSLRRLYASTSPLRILHLNQVNGLSPALHLLGTVVETSYQADLKLGSRVGDYFNEDICHLTFADQQFDLAIHSETLEHVFDFTRALDEVQRVLKPGGRQVYTIPLIHQRITQQRMRRGATGEILQVMPPSYHGNEGEFPVVWEFGSDFIQKRDSRITEIHYDNYWKNPTVFTLVERKPV